MPITKEKWKCDLCKKEEETDKVEIMYKKGWFYTRFRSSKPLSFSIADVSRIYTSPVYCSYCKDDMYRILKLNIEEDNNAK